MELKMTAARERTSFSALVRQKLGAVTEAGGKDKFWGRWDELAGKIAKKYPKARLSDKLIQMRYEQ